MSRSLCLPTRVLKVYTEAFTGFSHIWGTGGLKSMLLFQGYILGIAPTMGMGSKMYIPRSAERVRSIPLSKI